MSGYKLIRQIRGIEESLHSLGMVMCQPDHYHREFGDVVAIRPRDQDSLPIYSRDATLFVGTLEELEQWIRGVLWARQYDQLIFGRRHNSNRERHEQQYRNQQLCSILSQTGEIQNEAQ